MVLASICFWPKKIKGSFSRFSPTNLIPDACLASCHQPETHHPKPQPTFVQLTADLVNQVNYSLTRFVILFGSVTSLFSPAVLRHSVLLSKNVFLIIQLPLQTPVFCHQLNSPHLYQKLYRDSSTGEEFKSSGNCGSAAGQVQAGCWCLPPPTAMTPAGLVSLPSSSAAPVLSA